MPTCHGALARHNTTPCIYFAYIALQIFGLYYLSRALYFRKKVDKLKKNHLYNSEVTRKSTTIFILEIRTKGG